MVIYELNNLQNTLNGIKYEMKLKRNQYNREVMTIVSFQKMIQHIIK